MPFNISSSKTQIKGFEGNSGLWEIQDYGKYLTFNWGTKIIKIIQLVLVYLNVKWFSF
jgi:hypothetical protein